MNKRKGYIKLDCDEPLFWEESEAEFTIEEYDDRTKIFARTLEGEQILFEIKEEEVILKAVGNWMQGQEFNKMKLRIPDNLFENLQVALEKANKEQYTRNGKEPFTLEEFILDILFDLDVAEKE